MPEVGVEVESAFIKVTAAEVSEHMDDPIAIRKSKDRGTPLRDEAAKRAASAKLRNYDDLDLRSWIVKDATEVKVPVITGIVE